MRFRQTMFVGLLLVFAAFVVGLWFYPQLPDSIPSHWNAAGQVNGYLPKFWGVFLLPGVMAGTWLLLALLPRLAPRGYRLDAFLNAYGAISLAILAALLLFAVVVLLAAKGERMPMQRIAPTALGLLLLIIGNYLGKFRKNFFAGIRTPWTLASDEVWARTHRLGGWLFVTGGLVALVSGLIAPGAYATFIPIAAILAATLIPVVASYFIYRRLEGFDKNANDAEND